MKYRWMVSEDGGTTYTKEVKPSVSGDLFEWSNDGGEERASKRLQIATSLSFVQDDYGYFKAMRDTAGFCGHVPIRFEIWCGSEWVVFWNGRFAVGGGRWDYRKCRFDVKPSEDDKYTCNDERQNIRVNLMRAGVVDTGIYNLPPYEFFGCYYNDFGGQAACAEEAGFPSVTGWTEVGTDVIDSEYSAITYARYRSVTECVGGEPVAPSGSGWVLLENNCETDGTALYVKRLSDDDIMVLNNTGVAQGACSDGVAMPPEGEGIWILIKDCDDPIWPSLWARIEPLAIPLDTGRLLSECLSLVLGEMQCGIAGVRSDFFAINPVGDAPGYAPGVDYVTGRTTQVDHVVVAHKSDVIDPNAAQPATRGEMTFKELMRLLYTEFRVKWAIDDDGYLRLEHYSYWNTQTDLDLTTISKERLVEPFSHESLNGDVPSVERLTMTDTQGADFFGKDIVYSGVCVTRQGGGGEVEYTVSNVTTDVSMVISDPNVSRNGFVLLATTLNDGRYDTILDVGAISGSIVSNAPLSTANLMRDYWQHDRYLKEGIMNGQHTTFARARANVQQPAVTVMCLGCEILDFDPDKIVRTNLGQQHLDGVDAEIEKATLDTNGHLRLTLRYSK